MALDLDLAAAAAADVGGIFGQSSATRHTDIA